MLVRALGLALLLSVACSSSEEEGCKNESDEIPTGRTSKIRKSTVQSSKPWYTCDTYPEIEALADTPPPFPKHDRTEQDREGLTS